MPSSAPPSTWSVPAPGDLVAGKYLVEAEIGRGGLATILRAEHLGLGERVAMKVLLPRWASVAEVSERFEREGRAAAKVRSEHVARVFDVGRLDGGAPYIVMEHLEGCDLEAWIERRGASPPAVAIDWVMQAAEAVAEAHAAGIVHRDLKPANLFLTTRADGTACVKVLDFGISKRTDPGASRARMTTPDVLLGSPYAMAPEQILTPHDVDARVDVWALGGTLYELLAGRPPFDGASLPEIYHAIVHLEPPPLDRSDVPPALEAVVLRCLAKDPDARFADLAALGSALAAVDPRVRPSADRIARVLGGDRASLLPDGAPVPPLPLVSVTRRAPPPSGAPRGRGRIVAAACVAACAGLVLGVPAAHAPLLAAARAWASPLVLPAPKSPPVEAGAGQSAPSAGTAASAAPAPSGAPRGAKDTKEAPARPARRPARGGVPRHGPASTVARAAPVAEPLEAAPVEDDNPYATEESPAPPLPVAIPVPLAAVPP